MTAQIAAITNQIIIFAILMAIGFIAAKTDIFTKDALNTLSRLIVKIILPALIFSVVAGSGVTAREFLISGRFTMGVVFCFSLLILASVAMSKLCKLEGKSANIYVALLTFGNMGFMGIPLIQAIFKEPVAQVCIAVYTLVDMALLWTFGVYLCSRHQKNSNPLHAVRNMLNPTTVALCIAFIIMLFKIPVPDLLMSTIAGTGGTSKYLTLMYLGGALAYVSVDNIIKKPSILVSTIVKMLVLPVIVYYFLGFFLPQIPRTILTIIVGLPSMTTVAMMATTYQSDDEYATEMIFVTTLASLVTIPIISVVTNMMA
ncbi:MAG TPA: AEC family transporter [Methylomusa anaerophila]|uniref:Membrane transport protein n=1 Tax=Methylomusa anaerophila TaxID=1930071 RepID=A0A348AGA1_9FIRM|nr:AEC family transporter [Methylomusa anaerophila]BBB90099.1 membrane transport protein [Methylomusa anaerophila]HML88176.1 AEC family transporter [Methylomusa anaerophila]